ncbi:unnamed protein product [Amoebophrya sp. A25]|nr:unnamed protein product [Amoebophrya sp. A25]|eukprot:GSA25T00021092001.1
MSSVVKTGIVQSTLRVGLAIAPRFRQQHQNRNFGTLPYRLKWRWWNNETILGKQNITFKKFLQKLLTTPPTDTCFRFKYLREHAVDLLWSLKWYHIVGFSFSSTILVGAHAALLALGLAFIKKDYSEELRDGYLRDWIVDLKAVEESPDLQEAHQSQAKAVKEAMKEAFGMSDSDGAENFRSAARLLFPVEQEVRARVRRGLSIHPEDFKREYFQAERLSILRRRFGKRRTKMGQYKDVGYQVEASLESAEALCCEPALQHAAESLDSAGFVLLKNAISPEMLATLRRQIFGTANIRPDTPRGLGWHVKETDPNISHDRITEGRLHMNLRGSAIGEYFADWHRHWLPLCFHYLCSGDIERKIAKQERERGMSGSLASTSSSSAASATASTSGTLLSEQDQDKLKQAVASQAQETEKKPSTRTSTAELTAEEEYEQRLLMSELTCPRLYVAEVYLVMNDVVCPRNDWYTDSHSKSLTVLVPLDDFPEDSGQIEMLPGTHKLTKSDIPVFDINDPTKMTTDVEESSFLTRFLNAFRIGCSVRGYVTPSDIEWSVKRLATEAREAESQAATMSCTTSDTRDAGASSSSGITTTTATELPQEQQQKEFDEHFAAKEKEKRDRAWKAGDALVFDSRIIKRGGESVNVFRPGHTLLIRYERWDSRRIDKAYQHGFNVEGQRWKMSLGRYLDGVFRVYAAV